MRDMRRLAPAVRAPVDRIAQNEPEARVWQHDTELQHGGETLKRARCRVYEPTVLGKPSDFSPPVIERAWSPEDVELLAVSLATQPKHGTHHCVERRCARLLHTNDDRGVREASNPSLMCCDSRRIAPEIRRSDHLGAVVRRLAREGTAHGAREAKVCNVVSADVV